MKLALPNLASTTVMVVGDVMLDRYWQGTTSRISPEAPVPIVHVVHEEDRPGGAANVALNIIALGAGAALIGATGDDANADTLQTKLESVGVDCRFQRVLGVPTVTKLRVLSRRQQLIRLDFEAGFPHFDDRLLRRQVEDLLPRVGAMVVSDYGKGALVELGALIDAARAAQVPTIVDPKNPDFSVYRGATLVTPNLAEFEAATGPCPDEATLIERGLEIIEANQLEGILVTRGEQGMTLLRPSQPELHLPAKAREVYDVTGAGDTVVATIATALAAGCALPEAVAIANIAAGIVVAKVGTATLSISELAAGLDADSGSQGGLVNPAQLAVAVEAARANGERIVMTNGCFDILHAGHVSYLQQARALGDRLIVAVNDDASVRRLKGPGRPINALEQRMAVLAAMTAVDWVVPFSDDTPERLICDICPDVLVKGGDYSPEQIAGAPCVKEAGGRVTILPFVDGCSTTAILGGVRAAKQARDVNGKPQ